MSYSTLRTELTGASADLVSISGAQIRTGQDITRLNEVVKGIQDHILSPARTSMNEYILARQNYLIGIIPTTEYHEWRSVVTHLGSLSAFPIISNNGSYGDVDDQNSKINNWTIEKWATRTFDTTLNRYIVSAKYLDIYETYPPTAAQITEAGIDSKYTPTSLAEYSTDWDNGLEWIWVTPSDDLSDPKVYGIKFSLTQLTSSTAFLQTMRSHIEFKLKARYKYTSL